MTTLAKMSPPIFLVLLLTASCGATVGVDTPASERVDASEAFTIEEQATFDEPWAADFLPGTDVLVVTEKAGTIRGYDTTSGESFAISGAPKVDYGGQGGLGDVAFLQSEASDTIGSRTIYLSWAEAGEGDARGAAVGKGQLVCTASRDCAVEGLTVIWRQRPKVTGRGHYSHRLLLSPDERYLFVSSGDRQKLTPAQDTSNTLGTIVRLNLDGTPAAGNPFAERGSPSDEIWSFGHRNVLGLDWDAEGRLWNLEHGPRGGDELNLVDPGANYGWPVVSNGVHYNGSGIPDHETRPDLAAPAISWNPVIAPGDLHFYRGGLFPGWRGDALIPGLSVQSLVRVEIEGESAREAARYGFDSRIREVVEGPDGALWLLEDGKGAHLLRLTPKP
ncbi:PQQ-dependent sugar dehydrogenase [Altererythrobacter sp.]|uniref:PQQ-dependent sugar dehydrogenase n=1 Tax=Altererythrobacter sp. TaxID=1872480 RepID=UPI003D05E8CA